MNQCDTTLMSRSVPQSIVGDKQSEKKRRAVVVYRSMEAIAVFVQ